ncbi:hypothetical protein BLNAU_4720 [Blattamonas nauphoetae]|uniref:Uncharacterized protein n=1 Tax=Blattamonas nauphoetae TaxID=2049346 RepID=A0ABQ9Y8S9_9EUKA|nr:hypothetical protein BLNAU_4720 [Blattamonas nauphoetae]
MCKCETVQLATHTTIRSQVGLRGWWKYGGKAGESPDGARRGEGGGEGDLDANEAADETMRSLRASECWCPLPVATISVCSSLPLCFPLRVHIETRSQSAHPKSSVPHPLPRPRQAMTGFGRRILCILCLDAEDTIVD